MGLQMREMASAMRVVRRGLGYRFKRTVPLSPITQTNRSNEERRGLSLMRRASQNRLRLVPGCPAGSQREGLREDRHACPSRAADDDRADPGKDLAPDKRRHTDLRQAEDRVIAGDCGRGCESCRDDGTKDQWTNDRERDLSNAERERAGDDADEQRADDAGAAMKRRHAGRQSYEERQGVDSEGEDQPA